MKSNTLKDIDTLSQQLREALQISNELLALSESYEKELTKSREVLKEAYCDLKSGKVITAEKLIKTFLEQTEADSP